MRDAVLRGGLLRRIAARLLAQQMVQTTIALAQVPRPRTGPPEARFWLINLLFDGRPVACETELTQLLGQAR